MEDETDLYLTDGVSEGTKRVDKNEFQGVYMISDNGESGTSVASYVSGMFSLVFSNTTHHFLFVGTAPVVHI